MTYMDLGSIKTVLIQWCDCSQGNQWAHYTNRGSNKIDHLDITSEMVNVWRKWTVLKVFINQREGVRSFNYTKDGFELHFMTFMWHGDCRGQLCWPGLCQPEPLCPLTISKVTKSPSATTAQCLSGLPLSPVRLFPTPWVPVVSSQNERAF